jgi:hypothetical protein
MRFLITSGPGPDHDPAHDVPPDQALFDAYMKFNEDMHKAGVLVASEGLIPGGVRARVAVADGKRTVVDGPFAEAKELLGGLYIIEVGSREEAIAWAMRCPVGMATADVLDIFQMTTADDIPAEFVERIKAIAPSWSKTFTKKGA